MSTLKQLAFVISAALSLAFILGFVQITQQVPGKEQRREAARLFNEKYGNRWIIRMNGITGTPATIRGATITKYDGTPQAIARAFLDEEKTMLGIENIDTDLELTKTKYSEKGGTRLTYSQKYKGVPVLNSGYLIAVDNEGAVYYVSGDYFPEVNVETQPVLSSEQAVSAVITDLSGIRTKITKDPFVCIYVADRDKEGMRYLLAYKTTVEIDEDNMVGAWEYIIDALTGGVILKTSLIKDVSGSGTVYQTSPLYGSTDSETLYRLDDQSPLMLQGENVSVYNWDTSEASSQSGEFDYDPTGTHFDEVMAYYHADEFEEWLELYAGLQEQVDEVTIHTHSHYVNPITQMEVFAGIYSSTRVMYLADSGTVANGFSGWRDPAKEAAAIVHEYMHAVSEYFHSLNSNYEEAAMDEAYSDYFALAYKNYRGVSSDEIGDYILQFDPPYYLRNLDNDNHYPEDYDEENSPHYNGLIFSGALWDLRRDNDLDENVVDGLVLESIYNLDQSSSFLDGRDALIAAAQSGHSSYIDDIEYAFVAHGIPPYNVSITGPYSIDFFDIPPNTITWTAEADGGISPYSYDWYYYDEIEEQWYELEEGVRDNTYEIDYDRVWPPPYDFELKVVVADYEQEQKTDKHDVSVVNPPVLDGASVIGPIEMEWLDGGEWYAYLFGELWYGDATWYITLDGESTEEIEDDEIFTIGPESEYNDDFTLSVEIEDEETYESEEIEVTVNLYGGKVSAAVSPEGYALEQNYPNPFNPVTTIRYQLPEGSHVTLVVYNVRGQEVARLVDGYQSAGFYTAQWNASKVSSGIYLYRIQAGAFTDMKRMVVIK